MYVWNDSNKMTGHITMLRIKESYLPMRLPLGQPGRLVPWDGPSWHSTVEEIGEKSNVGGRFWWRW